MIHFEDSENGYPQEKEPAIEFTGAIIFFLVLTIILAIIIN